MALVDGYIKAQTAVYTAVWAFFYAGGAVLTRRGGVVGVVGGCIGLRSLFNKKFMLVIKKKERKRKKNLCRGLRRVSSPRSTSLGAVVMT